MTRARMMPANRRRSSPGLILSYGPSLYLDARHVNGLNVAPPADGEAIQTWTDLSGNGRHATQAAAARRPLYRAAHAPIGGIPALVFDGVDDVLNVANMPLSADVTVYLVFEASQADGFSGVRTIFARANAATHTDPWYRWAVHYFGFVVRYDIRRDSNVTGADVNPAELASRHVVTYLPNTQSLYHNHNLHVAPSASVPVTYPNGNTLVTIGGNIDAVEATLGSFSALAVFPSQHNDATRLIIENELLS